ncbi:SH3 domain-containing protein [Acidisoma sp. 7E03]
MSFRTTRPLIHLAASGLGILLLVASARTWAEDAKTAAKPAASAPATTAPPKPVQDPHVGSSSGLPLPRFVSLRADSVNLRVGPGDQYPILWVYHRVGLPVEVLREFDVWRLVVDSEGTKGWMHEATLTGNRHFVINGTTPVTLYGRASTDSDPRAQLMPGVVGSIERCAAGGDWCRVRADRVSGWLERSEFWGTLPGEKIPAK